MLIVVEILCAMLALFLLGIAVYAYVGLKREEKKIALLADEVVNGVKNYAKACALPVVPDAELSAAPALYGSCEEAFLRMNAESKRNCLKIREKLEKSIGAYNAAVGVYNDRIGSFPQCIAASLFLRGNIGDFKADLTQNEQNEENKKQVKGK